MSAAFPVSSLIPPASEPASQIESLKHYIRLFPASPQLL